MIIHLKADSKEQHERDVLLTITERLPHWVQGEVKIEGTYQVRAIDDHYFLNLKINGMPTVICQRCLEAIPFDYHQEMELAVSPDEARAEQLMFSYDCLTSEGEYLNLMDVITDDLHLNLPEKPHEMDACSLNLSEMI